MRILEFILRRFLTAIFVLAGVSVITFFLSRVVPADAAALYLGAKARPEELQQARSKLGLDRPLPVQYAVYIGDLMHGDLGTSIGTKRPVLQELTDRIPATLELLLFGMLIAVLVGIPLGVISARWQGTWADIFVRVISIFGVSMPAFYLGLLMQILFFRNLGLFPLSGRVDSSMRFNSPIEPLTSFFLIDTILSFNWIAFRDVLWHLVLPAFTLAAYPIGLIARMNRAAMLEALGQDYIRTARAYGIQERIITYLYALKNAISPTLTVIGLTVAYALTGTFFVEVIFNWPGLGLFTVRSLLALDYPAIMGITLLGAAGYVMINLVVDLLHVWIDPRIRLK